MDVGRWKKTYVQRMSDNRSNRPATTRKTDDWRTMKEYLDGQLQRQSRKIMYVVHMYIIGLYLKLKMIKKDNCQNVISQINYFNL